jgi:hypothetical protein
VRRIYVCTSGHGASFRTGATSIQERWLFPPLQGRSTRLRRTSGGPGEWVLPRTTPSAGRSSGAPADELAAIDEHAVDTGIDLWAQARAGAL